VGIRRFVGAGALALLSVATFVPDVAAPAPVPVPLAPAAATFAGFNLVDPERVLDTRSGLGAPAGSVGEHGVLTLPVAGQGPVPPDAAAVLLNVTVDAPTRGGYVTVFPAGAPVPPTSSINMPAGKTVANLVAVRLGAGGAVSFFNAFGESHLIADVTAYVRDDGHFVALSPDRVLDTRSGAGTGIAAPVSGGAAIELDVLGRHGVPATGVGAVVLNVTVDQPSDASYVTVWPAGVARPDASSLNMTPGQTVANLVVAPVGSNGRVAFFNERGTTHLVADVMGYLPASAAYLPLTPVRVMDTRTGLGASLAPVGAGHDVVLELGERLPSEVEVSGVVLNVTAAAPSAHSFVTVYPADRARPDASNLNTAPGENVPNAVIVRPDPAGRVVLHNERGTTHLVVDLVGLVPRVVLDTGAPTTTTTVPPATTSTVATTLTSVSTTSTTTTPATTTPTTTTPTTTTSAPTTTQPPASNGRCVIGAPGGGGGPDPDTGFSPGYPYDSDPGQYTTKTMPGYPELIDLQAAAVGCDEIIVHGFSEGGRRAKEWYCGGESLGGRIGGYVIDDPNYLPDDGQPCTPAAGVQVVLYGTRMGPTDDRWTVDVFLEGTGYGAVMEKTAARLGTPILVSPRYFHEPYTRPSPPEIASGSFW
jgi:hypothetical protein